MKLFSKSTVQTLKIPTETEAFPFFADFSQCYRTRMYKEEIDQKIM
jgi:hypothetical protein